MSRLYIKKKTDLSKTGNRGTEEARAAIYWGSTHDSKLAGEIRVYWPKDQEKPTVTFSTGSEILNNSALNTQVG